VFAFLMTGLNVMNGNISEASASQVFQLLQHCQKMVMIMAVAQALEIKSWLQNKIIFFILIFEF
jgi:ssDNA-specific exonuclease RecJ